jgi:hypothetical protein
MIDWNLLAKIISIITLRYKDKIPLSDYMGLTSGYQARNEYQVAYHLFEIVRVLVRSEVNDPELYDLINKAVIPS